MHVAFLNYLVYIHGHIIHLDNNTWQKNDEKKNLCMSVFFCICQNQISSCKTKCHVQLRKLVLTSLLQPII